MSSACGICNQVIASEDVESSVRCAGGCDKSVHLRCLKGDADARKTRSSRDWKCKECRNLSSAQSSTSSTGTSITKDFFVRVLEDFKREVFGELKNFKQEMGELSVAVNFLSNKMDESTQLMKEVRTELAVVKKENADLRAQNTRLANEVGSLKDKVRSLEQYSRKNNIEISGLPVTPKESVIDLVKDVGTSLGVELSEKDVSAAHRVPSFRKERTPSLIVQFVSRASRDNIISKFREKKGMTARDVNAAFPTNRVYINEHLSPENKVFLAKLKEKCKSVGYAYAWCREGKFFVRKAQGERYVRVDTYVDIEKLQ